MERYRGEGRGEKKGEKRRGVENEQMWKEAILWFSPTQKGLINLREATQNKRASLIKGNHFSFWPGKDVSGQSNMQLGTHQTFVETPPSV